MFIRRLLTGAICAGVSLLLPNMEIACNLRGPNLADCFARQRESNLRFRISGFEVQDLSNFRFLSGFTKYVKAFLEQVFQRELQ
jgi:hypothetical protein